MKKFFFVLFVIITIVLVLLVDWREKLAEFKRQGIAQKIGQLWQKQDTLHLPQTTPEMISEDWLPQPPLLSEQQAPAAEKIVTRQQRPRRDKAMGQAKRVTLPAQPFQDVAEQPYLSSSRELLRKIARNYDAISSGEKRKTAAGKQQ